MSLRYLSLFSGIEAAHLAVAPLGWTTVAVAEIDPAACAVLGHRLPDVPNLGDVRAVTGAQIAALGPIDVVIGGSPCQDLSVAGRRAGLAGARSHLFYDLLRIFHAAREHCGARWLLWENVPGVFSSRAGADFADVAGALAGSRCAVPDTGWGSEGVALGPHGLLEWSLLDAQWFGLAQRRRRVFAVLDTGDWPGRFPVLLEPTRLRGDPAPRQGAQPPLAAARDSTSADDDRPCAGVMAFGCKDSNPAGSIAWNLAPTLRAMMHRHSTANGGGQIAIADCRATELGVDLAYCLCSSTGSGNLAYVLHARQVRRLTPTEYERLQGIVDGWTQVPNPQGRPMADGPRYRLLGNSFAVPVVRWIARRLQQAHRISAQAAPDASSI